MVLDVDEILEKIGPLGKFQIRTVLVGGWMEFCMALFVLAPTFLAGEPGWKCAENSTGCNETGHFILGMEDYHKRCDMKRSDWVYLDTFTSVTTEWDLVCDNAILSSVTSSLYFVGFLIGVFGLGFLSDMFGRRKIAYFSVVLCAIIALTASFSPNMAYFNFCRFGIGMFGGGSSMVLFLICMEVSGVKHRGTAGTGLWVFWVLGTMAISPLAYIFRDWRDLSLALGIISMTVIPLWWFLPETPRWLVVNGRIKEAEDVLRKIAEVNGEKYPDEPIKLPEQPTTRKSNFFDLFRTKKYAISILIQWFAWAVNALVYYCVSLGTSNIGGNMYLTYFLLCLVEMPATLGTIYFIMKFGRKYSVIGCMWLAAFASICAALFPMHESVGYTVGRVLFAIIAKFMVTVSFDGIYVWSGELIPTVIRNLAMGSCSSAARVGSFSASYVNYLAQFHTMIPFGIMAVTSIVAGALCFYLPETCGRPTPEDFEEDESKKELQKSFENLEKNGNENTPDADEAHENMAKEEISDITGSGPRRLGGTSLPKISRKTPTPPGHQPHKGKGKDREK